jgi:EmrB/QacA subfamily drug resistance transporter
MMWAVPPGRIAEPDEPDELDPRRWWALALALLAISICVIDNTVLTVSIPTMMRDLDASLPGIQWVLSGYSLSYASFLVIGGRLGDMYGPRRMIMIGAATFGLGSLIASASTTVPQLVLGEAVIEGMGAAMLTPSTISVLATSFRGRERALAFAAWGTVIGAGSAFGPLLGGYLTTYHSWRWAFRINVIIAPIVILGALLVIRRDALNRARQRLDVLGGTLLSSATFLVVFGFTQGDTYGWLRPRSGLAIGDTQIWPGTAPLSPVPIAFVLGATFLASFVRTELRKERGDQDPLFALSQFRILTFRYGVSSSFLMAVAGIGGLLVVPVFLQEVKGLSAIENGLWVLPLGVGVVAGAQIGGRLTSRVGPTNVVRYGMTVSMVGILLKAFVLRPEVTFWQLLPVFWISGIGGGFFASQINTVVLHGIQPGRTAAASAVNTTARQTGGAFGAALIGAIYAIVARDHGFASAARPALLFSAVLLGMATLMTWQIPHLDDAPVPAPEPAGGVAALDPAEA